MIFTVRVQADNSIEIDTTSGLSEFRILFEKRSSFDQKFLSSSKKEKKGHDIN